MYRWGWGFSSSIWIYSLHTTNVETKHIQNPLMVLLYFKQLQFLKIKVWVDWGVWHSVSMITVYSNSTRIELIVSGSDRKVLKTWVCITIISHWVLLFFKLLYRWWWGFSSSKWIFNMHTTKGETKIISFRKGLHKSFNPKRTFCSINIQKIHTSQNLKWSGGWVIYRLLVHWF